VAAERNKDKKSARHVTLFIWIASQSQPWENSFA